MNTRNPHGPVGVRSPGRRALSVECAAFDARLDPRLKSDPQWRKLTAGAARLAAKVESLPRQARTLRLLATKAANEAIKAAQAYQDELIARLDAEAAAKRAEQSRKRAQALAELA